MDCMHASVSSVLVLAATSTGRTRIADILRDAGMGVIEASRGDEALDLARDRRPELIVTDLGLSDLDGDEFTLALRTDPATRGTPVLFCGERHDERELWRLASECGVARVLVKPYAPEELMQAIGELFTRSPPP